MKNSYGRFGAMIATSTALMYVLMYFNSWALDHVYFSETRVYMALYMGAMMAVVMLSFMLGMYVNKRVNAGIYVGAAILFGVALWLLRSQETVQDISWMKAMIPHHSIAILTSERAELSDPRVRDLAEKINEMKALIADLQGGPPATPEVDGE